MNTLHLRAIGALGSGLALVLLLTGCGGSDADSDTGSDNPSSGSALLPEGEGKTDYPLTLETPFGETTLEKRPERIAIVTANTVDTDAVVALGGTPVFAPSTVERNPWLDQEIVEGIETRWESEPGAEISAEKVAATEPDLIVALAAYDTFDQTRFDRLSAIAPVLYAAEGQLTWQEIATEVGEALDLGEAAESAVDAAEETIQGAASDHPEFEGKTATHVIVYEEEYGPAYVSYPGSETALLFERLGFELPEAASEFDADTVLSMELVEKIDADFLLLSTFPGADYFMDSPLVQAVPAVKDSRAVVNPADEKTEINYFGWGLNNQSVVSVPWLIEQLADFGAQALG